MPDKPLEEVMADEAADEATDGIFQLKTKMNASGQVMKYSHVREQIRDGILKCLRLFRERLLAHAGATPVVAETLSPAERIYAAYPRKVGRKTALRAITTALKAVQADNLLALTKAYAEAVAKWPPAERQYIPYPATWFNRGSYGDDPKEWARGTPDKAEAKDTTAGYTKF